jgi:hypothetical protein
MSERVCRCPECRDPAQEMESGKVDFLKAYGQLCMNCGHYSPTHEDESEGICLKFAIRAERKGMSLMRRFQGQLREKEHAFIVGGGYFCGDYRPLHDRPEPDNPLVAFWAEGNRLISREGSE